MGPVVLRRCIRRAAGRCARYRSLHTWPTFDQQAHWAVEEPLIGQSIKENRMSDNRKDRPRTAESGDAQLRHDAHAGTVSATPVSGGNGASPPDQPLPGSAFENWIAYWQPITRDWPPLDAEGIAAVAAVVACIDQRRAAAAEDNDSGGGGDGGDGVADRRWS